MTTPHHRSASRRNRWLVATALGVLVCLGVFAANVLTADVHSSNVWGVSYGIAATVFLLAAAIYGVRRRAMKLATRRGLGSARAWLGFHTFTGTLFLLSMLMHSGFGLPEGWVTWGLWLLGVWTVLSGFVGLGLQRWIPRRLTSSLSIEVHYQRIPELVDDARARADKLTTDSGETVRGFYERRVARAFEPARWSWSHLLSSAGEGGKLLREFDFLSARLTGDERQRLEELRRLFQAKSEMDAHYTLQRALRLWLYLHVPPTLALLALVGVHVFTVLYY